MYFNDFAKTAPDWDPALPQYQPAAHQLVQDCAAAMEVNGFIADTVAYPFLVLLHAAASAEVLPAVFFLNAAQGLRGSVLNKHAFVQLGAGKVAADTGQVWARASSLVKPLVQAIQPLRNT